MIEIVFFDPISDFAKFIALSRGQIITNPIRQLYAEQHKEYSCLIGLVII
jgi:hypothetical protein